MDDHLRMRASDADRQQVIERLRTALDEGRLKMDEYLERMGQASEAVTYGDLAPLYADLPVDRLGGTTGAGRPRPRPRGPCRPSRDAAFAACPPRSGSCGRSGPLPCRSTW